MISKLSILLAFLWFGSAAAQCGSMTAELTVTIQYDDKPGETSVELTDTTTNGVTAIQIAKIANQEISSTTCVATGTLFKVAVKDSGGNGIAGHGYVSISINGRLIAAVSDFGSEVVYYFSAAAQVCGDPRWVLDIKYDTNPTGVSAALTNSAGALLFSLTGLNVAELANQFLHIDRCASPASYTFSITAAGGISSPGFYRIFIEQTLLAVGGGDSGFSGTESTAFTITDGPVPTPAPTPDVCEDAWEEKFLDQDGLFQNCIWLYDRFETEGPRHCIPGLPAYSLCEETCGACSDSCPPDDDTAKFELLGVKNRKCVYIRMRLSADFDQFFPQLCDPEGNGYKFCTESCENCDATTAGEGDGEGDGDGSGGNDPVDTSPAPTPDPMLTDPCDDSAAKLIFINSTIGEVSCTWLKARPAEQATYCVPGQISNAYNVCEETCGKCSDSCEDTAGGTVTLEDGSTQPCSWISEDALSRRATYCFPGSSAWDVCKEACGNCV